MQRLLLNPMGPLGIYIMVLAAGGNLFNKIGMVA
jgi:hypothetical protein